MSGYIIPPVYGSVNHGAPVTITAFRWRPRFDPPWCEEIAPERGSASPAGES